VVKPSNFLEFAKLNPRTMLVIYNDLKENPSSNSISYKRLNKPKARLGQTANSKFGPFHQKTKAKFRTFS
jgi:hypothetical protein